MLLYYYSLMNFKNYLKDINFALVSQLYQKFLIFFKENSIIFC